MPESIEAIQDFLAQKRVAVVGVSRNPKDFTAMLFRDLRKRGYDVVPVNPNATEVEGLRCFDSVQAIDPPASAALLMTTPARTEMVLNDCHHAGIKRVWIYGVSGQSAKHTAAVEFCRRKGISVVPGYCPYMFLGDTAFFHRFHGGVLKLIGRYPR